MRPTGGATRSDNRGKFTLPLPEEMPRSEIALLVTCAEYVPLEIDFAAESKHDLDVGELTLVPSLRSGGRVIAESGESCVGARVQFFCVHGGRRDCVWTGITGPSGVFEFAWSLDVAYALAERAYIEVLTLDGGQARLENPEPGRRDLLLTARRADAALTLVPTDWPRSDVEPVQVELDLIPVTADRAAGITRIRRRVRVGGESLAAVHLVVPHGRYRLQQPPVPSWPERHAEPYFRVPTMALDLQPGQEHVVELRTTPETYVRPRAMTLTILHSGEEVRPIPGAAVSVAGMAAVADDQGVVTLPITASLEDEGRLLALVKHPEFPDLQDWVEVPGGKGDFSCSLTLTSERLRTAHRFAVRTEDGTYLPRAAFILADDSGRVVRRLSTAPSASPDATHILRTYSAASDPLEQLRGAASLIVRHDGFAESVFAVDSVRRSLRSVDPHTVVLSPAQRFRVRVRDPQGRGVSGARARLWCRSPTHTFRGDCASLCSTGLTDQGGRLSLDRFGSVAGHTALLCVSHPARGSALLPLDVLPAQELVVDLGAQPLRLRGVTRDAAGQAVEAYVSLKPAFLKGPLRRLFTIESRSSAAGEFEILAIPAAPKWSLGASSVLSRSRSRLQSERREIVIPGCGDVETVLRELKD